jgi:hypothetical protein
MSVSAQALLSTKVLDDVLGTNTYSPRYTFNNGVVEAGKFCSPKNWHAISDTMTKALNDQKGKNRSRRQLVRVASRALNAKCSSCSGKPLCLFQSGIGCARIYGGSRRLLTLKDQSKQPQSMRVMQDDGTTTVATNPTMCADSVAAIDAALAQVGPIVSSHSQWTATSGMHQVFAQL